VQRKEGEATKLLKDKESDLLAEIIISCEDFNFIYMIC